MNMLIILAIMVTVKMIHMNVLRSQKHMDGTKMLIDLQLLDIWSEQEKNQIMSLFFEVSCLIIIILVKNTWFRTILYLIDISFAFR